MTIRIASLHRYPVKGLSPESVPQARLETGGYFPGDRIFAIENGPSGFDPADPRHKAKTHYLMLMRNEALARLRSRYDDATDRLVIEGKVARAVAGAAAAIPRNARRHARLQSHGMSRATDTALRMPPLRAAPGVFASPFAEGSSRWINSREQCGRHRRHGS